MTARVNEKEFREDIEEVAGSLERAYYKTFLAQTTAYVRHQTPLSRECRCCPRCRQKEDGEICE